MSADYDKITRFFEDLDLYLNRLKILENWIPPVAELKVAIARVLTSVLVLCGICVKYVKMKRFGNYPFSSVVFLYEFPRNFTKNFLAEMLIFMCLYLQNSHLYRFPYKQKFSR